MDLSIVIPAYNEAHKISRDVLAAGEFLASRQLSGEVIVADDGSEDQTASAAESAGVPTGVAKQVLRLAHRGKGSAVREGVKATRGDYVMFADSGVCVPFEDAIAPLQLLRDGKCDIAHGSRKMATSVIDRSQTFYRRMLSRSFRWVVLRYMDLPRNLTDTQCGFKLYRGEIARTLYAQSVIDGFMFDLEILMRARRAGYRVVEFPVHWACDPDSRLRPARILGSTVSELREVKRVLAEEKRVG